jgi:hypothetical protein
VETRFQRLRDELLADCQVPPAAFRGAMRRLETFAQPFVATLPSPESQHHSRIYLSGLLSRANASNLQVLSSQGLRNSVTSYTKL